MIEPKPKPAQDAAPANDFAREAEGKSSGIFAELWGMMRANKKWWLMPTIVALLLIGVLVMATSGVLAPLIYTLF